MPRQIFQTEVTNETSIDLLVCGCRKKKKVITNSVTVTSHLATAVTPANNVNLLYICAWLVRCVVVYWALVAVILGLRNFRLKDLSDPLNPELRQEAHQKSYENFWKDFFSEDSEEDKEGKGSEESGSATNYPLLLTYVPKADDTWDVEWPFSFWN